MRTPATATATGVPTVLHVVPSSVARGAQREARALADRLDQPGARHHRVLSLFGGPAEVPVDLSLDHRGHRAAGVGIDPRLVVRLRGLLGDVDPAVVVAHGSEPLKYLVPAMLAHRRPLAYYAIGTYSGAHGRAQEWLWKLLLHRPDVIVAEGHEVRAECIARFGVAGRDVVFVPNGRDPTEFRPADQPKPPTPTRVVFVGALTDGKRPERFLDVVRTLRARGVHLDAAVVGAGPLYDRMVARAESAGVELLGARSDVPDLLRQADILVFPSLPSGEGMPGVLIEAGLSGLATVATDVPGVRSVVHDGVTGFVVGTEDVDAMVRSVARLVDDVELRTSMGRAARAHCTAHYSVDVVARAWSDVLQPLVDGAGRERPHP